MLDWLLKGALIVDGTGTPPFPGDLGIQGERIAELGSLDVRHAHHIVQASHRLVSPGFIDMHSHSDLLYHQRASLAHKICQGVSTELIGQDGTSAAPLLEPGWAMKDFMNDLKEKKPALNVATLVGHGNLRRAVMGDWNTPPSPEEMERMKELLANALDQGALGLSLGLIYPPGCYSKRDELIGLAGVVEAHGSILVAHIRDEQDGIIQSLEEMLTIGKATGCRTHISHLKCLGKKNWGRMPQVLEMLESGSRQGIDLSFDQYPYTASCTSLSVLLPDWALEGGWKGFQESLNSSRRRGEILAAMRQNIENRGGASSITIASVRDSGHPAWLGKTLDQIASETGLSPCELSLQMLDEKFQVVAIYHAISEQDVEKAMTHPLQVVGSDGMMESFPHPRTFGTFPRIIHHFSRERKLFPVEEAIRKMTSAPAERLRIKTRGKVAPGAYADLTVFSLEGFRDRATFEDPSRLASGLDWLFVNGVPLIEEGKRCEVYPGQVLRSG